MAAQAPVRLQEGIYFRKDGSPRPSAYRLVVLGIRGNIPRPQVRAALATMWGRLEQLRAGIVEDVDPAAATVDPARLTCLLGFGAPLFTRYPELAKPDGLDALGPLPFQSLRWAAADRRTGEGDLAVQLIADSELAVDRAAVEIWLWTSKAGVPLKVINVFDGFKRDDKRSWLGFHDGINNIESDARRGVIEAGGGNPGWMDDGTYMAFFRLAIDLAAWRKLTPEVQAITVGRDKLTGCPLVRVDPGLVPVPIAGCPAGAVDPKSPAYIDPPLPGVAQSHLRRSHINRTNLDRQVPVEADQSNRIFRQGYEFVESLGDERLRVGLNFVSFQRSLGRLQRILHLPGWLGDASFGGTPDAAMSAVEELAPLRFVSVIGGGFYAVPPMPAAGQPFPGAEIF